MKLLMFTGIAFGNGSFSIAMLNCWSVILKLIITMDILLKHISPPTEFLLLVILMGFDWMPAFPTRVSQTLDGMERIMGILATPPANIALWSGFINHWFPLIRPAIKPLIPGGVPYIPMIEVPAMTTKWCIKSPVVWIAERIPLQKGFFQEFGGWWNIIIQPEQWGSIEKMNLHFLLFKKRWGSQWHHHTVGTEMCIWDSGQIRLVGGFVNVC